MGHISHLGGDPCLRAHHYHQGFYGRTADFCLGVETTLKRSGVHPFLSVKLHV